MHFLECQTEDLNAQYVIIVLDNGLALNRHETHVISVATPKRLIHVKGTRTSFSAGTIACMQGRVKSP